MNKVENKLGKSWIKHWKKVGIFLEKNWKIVRKKLGKKVGEKLEKSWKKSWEKVGKKLEKN